MAVKNERRTLQDADGNDVVVVCTQFDGITGTDLFLRVSEILSSSAGMLGVLAGTLKEDGGDDTKKALAAIDALSVHGPAIFAKIREGGGVKLIQKLISGCTRKGFGDDTPANLKSPTMFAAAYTGNPIELIQTVVFAIQVNWGKSIAQALTGGATAEAGETLLSVTS